MTANIAGAPSYEKVDWNAMDWRKAHQNVRRLQARIVKATQLLCETAFSDERLEGLSRMRENCPPCHAQDELPSEMAGVQGK